MCDVPKLPAKGRIVCEDAPKCEDGVWVCNRSECARLARGYLTYHRTLVKNQKYNRYSKRVR